MRDSFQIYKARLYRYRFLILWIAFLLDFLTPQSIFDSGVDSPFQLLTFFLSMLAGVLVLLARKRLFVILLLIGSITVLLRLLNVIADSNIVLQVSHLLQISFYAIIVYEIFRELLDFSKVNLNTIGAALAGFYVIGLLGGVVFTLLEYSNPGSFAGLNQGDDVYGKMQYFSFIALTTIGFGDISPITEIAQRVTVLFGLIGNFYSTIIIGIILSKFIANRAK